MRLTEGRNTGFRKILNALENNGSPKPVFFTDDERLSFTTTLFIHPGFKNDTVNDTVKIDLTKREREIYLLITMNEHISIDEMAKISGVSRATVNRAIKGLKAKNYISRYGSDKNGKWIVLE